MTQIGRDIRKKLGGSSRYCKYQGQMVSVINSNNKINQLNLLHDHSNDGTCISGTNGLINAILNLY